jgi:hypothetical protein
MRKLIWCCSAAALLSAGSFLSLAYYSYCCPHSLVGRAMQTIAEVSIAMQPLSGLTTLAFGTHHANAPAGSIEECIPDEPRPIEPEPAHEQAECFVQECPVTERAFREMDAAPIVIDEDEPMPPVVVDAPPLALMPIEQVQELPASDSQIFMPYCKDDEEQPVMPNAADGDETKSEAAGEEADASVFKEWMELFESNKGEKIPTMEELPPPAEDGMKSDPNCQEDPHRHEQYSGCPRVTCPYTGKTPPPAATFLPYDYPSCKPEKKKGAEESSEEPAQPSKKPHRRKGCKSKDECPRTQGVDTMEYRKSDAGLNEYGPGPQH